jgi:hypothetical protein
MPLVGSDKSGAVHSPIEPRKWSGQQRINQLRMSVNPEQGQIRAHPIGLFNSLRRDGLVIRQRQPHGGTGTNNPAATRPANNGEFSRPQWFGANIKACFLSSALRICTPIDTGEIKLIGISLGSKPRCQRSLEGRVADPRRRRTLGQY